MPTRSVLPCAEYTECATRKSKKSEPRRNGPNLPAVIRLLAYAQGVQFKIGDPESRFMSMPYQGRNATYGTGGSCILRELKILGLLKSVYHSTP